MKKIAPKKAKLRDLIGKKRWRASLSRRRHFKRDNLENTGRDRPDSFYIKAPDIIEIYDADDEDAKNFKKTMTFFNKVKTGFVKDNVVLDFRKTRHVSAAAMLMLYAIIESSKKPGRSKILYPKNYELVKKVLQIANIDKIVRGSNISYNDLSERSHIPVISSQGSKYQEEIIDHIQKRIYSDKLTPELEYKYGDAVSETIYNVKMHAYETGNENKQWWLLCSVVDNRLFLAIYDLGVGIPNTVVERDWFSDIISRIHPKIYFDKKLTGKRFRLNKNGVTDKDLIQYSMMADISATKESKHGQGSKSIKALVEGFSDGKLHIFSGKGLYKMTGDECKVELFDLATPVRGTLIQWSTLL